jgi:regulator of protease activity HflC (stomatin/prohibitin superfamily)
VGFGIVGLFVLKSIRNKNGDVSINLPTVATGVLTLMLALVGLSSFGTLGAGEHGVVLRFGGVTGRVLEPGLYGVMPVIESVHAMDVRIQKESQKVLAASKDLQSVTTEVAVNYSLDPTKVANTYRTLGDNVRATIIDPSIQEAVKSVTAKFNAEKLIAERHSVKDMLTEELTTRLAVNGILVEAVSITDFAFSVDFMEAIEAKVTATQQALKAENDLKTKQFERDQAIATAQGQAEAIRIQAQAIQNQGGKEYVTLKAIEKWDGSVPQWVMGGSSGQSPIPFIQLAPPTAGK